MGEGTEEGMYFYLSLVEVVGGWGGGGMWVHGPPCVEDEERVLYFCRARGWMLTLLSPNTLLAPGMAE